MKTIKTLFTILFLMTLLMACEAESVNDEVGIEINDQIGGEEDDDTIHPEGHNQKR